MKKTELQLVLKLLEHFKKQFSMEMGIGSELTDAINTIKELMEDKP